MTQRAHLIGICGAGMSAVARLLQQAGWAVTGSDQNVYPPVSLYLERIGLHPIEGHDPANLPENPDLIVIGKHAKLVPEENAEVRAALERHRDKVRSFPEVLAELTEARRRIVVAGSYGKSTLTALLTHCLKEAAAGPGWFIGAIPRGFAHSSDMGDKGPFVFEGDEYPSANWDDRSKFLHYRADEVLLTSATHDHVNIFPTLEDYHRPFRELLAGLQSRDGRLVGCTDEGNARGLFEGYGGPKTSYGLDGTADVTATDIVLGNADANEPTRFTLVMNGERHEGVATRELGRHAVQNACGAAALLVGGGLMDLPQFKRGLDSFGGLERRLDRKLPGARLPVYEGFGSSYEKARAAIEAIGAHYPDRKLVVLFEPHAFTWRNREAIAQYDTAFKGTQTVFLFAPPEHGASTHDQVSHTEIADRVAGVHPDARPLSAAAIDRVADALDPDRDVLLILSSGSFGGTLKGLLSALSRRFAG